MAKYGKYKHLLKKGGIRLDIGCGNNKQPGMLGMDITKQSGVDIVHDIENIPYPLPDESCIQILLSHVIEHMCPKHIFKIMNELWRIMKPGGQLLISMPFASSPGFWQDPSHCHAWSESTAYYFDPHPMVNGVKMEWNMVYNVYKPKPWKLLQNDFDPAADMRVTYLKRPMEEASAYFKKETK